MAYSDFPEKIYVRSSNKHMHAPTLEIALGGSTERIQIAEYVLNKVVEAKMVPDICAEVA